MAEMNNSIYGNPSSLTIHNEKNMKSGKPIYELFKYIQMSNARLKYTEFGTMLCFMYSFIYF